MLILASASDIRARLLQAAAVPFEVDVARLDEPAIRASLLSEGARGRDVADALAEMKALRVSNRHPEASVIGCDQVLEFDGRLLSKPESPQAAVAQITALQGKTHHLHSAAVVVTGGAPDWRHVSTVRLTMASASAEWIAGYVARNWDSIRHAVGGYKLEEEGARLFSRVEGDYFAVLGLPLLELLTHLKAREILSS